MFGLKKMPKQRPKNTTRPKPPPQTPVGIWDRPWAIAVLALILVAAVLAAYSNTHRAPFVLDDIDSIVDNPTLRSWQTAFFPPGNSGITVSGRPMLNASLALNYAFFKGDATGYHLTNILIHALAGLALFGVVRRTCLLPNLRDRLATHATTLAWLIALCWSLHPLQTESVTYTIQRAESLAGLFYLLTLYAFIRSTSSASRSWAALAVISCWLGMASKETAASDPLIVFFFDRAFISGSFRESWRQRRSFYIALGAGWLLLGALVANTAGRGGSVGFSSPVTWWEYALTQTTAIMRYLQLSLWPQGLVFDYGTFVQKDPAMLVLCSLGILVLLSATLWALWRKPMLGFLGLWFFAILAPSSSIIPVITQTVAEHRMYLPLATVIIALVMAAYGIAEKFHKQAWLILFLIPIASALATYHRNSDYRSTISLWSSSNEAWPDNIRALNCLGLAFSDSGQPTEAAKMFSEAIAIEPNYAEALGNLGVIKIKSGAIAEGMAMVEKSIALKPDHPGIQGNLGNAMLEAGNNPGAVEAYEKALTLGFDTVRIRYNLAIAYDNLGKFVEAEKHLRIALPSLPSDDDAHINYARILRSLNRVPEASEHLQIALEINPRSARAHSLFGNLLVGQGMLEAGISHLRKAVEFKPDSAQAHYLLADALVEAKQLDEAVQHYEKLLRLAPPTAHILSNLGFIYAQLGHPIEARNAFREALKLDPKHESARENLARVEAFLSESGSK